MNDFQEETISGEQEELGSKLRAEQAEEKAQEISEPISGERGAAETIEQIKRLQKIWRTVNAASAASLVGSIITFLLMNLQLIFGNLVRLPFVPPLGKIEIALLGVLDLAILINFLIFMSLIRFIWPLT